MGETSVLEVDGGNSGYKWRLLKESKIISSGRFAREELLAGFEAVVRGLQGPVSARVASVAGVQADTLLLNVLETLGVQPVYFAKVARDQAGVRCGYEDLSQLGVDRWLAVLAASNEFEGPLVVADFGTALTLDFVDSSRNHAGGYIIPGWGLMCQALIEGTAIDVTRIPFDFETEVLQPGVSSLDAIGRGRLLCMSAFVDAGLSWFKSRSGENVQLVCTGGDALRILPFLDRGAVFRPDLILDGLILALP
ncbi:MAG: type III pantothenate kinase [Porticoccaceae bacterium]